MPNTSATLKPGGRCVVPQGTQLTLTQGPFKVADPPDSSDTATGWLREIKSPLILQPGPAALTDGVRQLHDIIARWTKEAA